MRLLNVMHGQELPALVLGATPQQIGRSPLNHLVLDRHDAVSAQHATVWADGSQGWIRDLGSHNGTFVNGERVRLSGLQDGDTVTLGDVTFVVRGAPGDQAPTGRVRMLEDVASGVRYPIPGTRLVLGSGETADLQLDVPSDQDVLLLLHDDGQMWLSSLDEDRSLPLMTPFQVGGRTFRVVETEEALGRTADLSPQRTRYRLVTRFDGPVGPHATLHDPQTGRTHTVTAETRATLLYVLARARLEPGDDQDGWRSDGDVGTGVWGRKTGHDARKLHVLIFRLRKELRDAGFDPWFIEKRQRAVRLVLDDVEVG